MEYVFLAVFAVSGIVHLYASYKQEKKLRNWTKGFIVSALLGWYLVASGQPRAVTALALFFSWLGDVLLIPHGSKWFTAGGIAFMVSHFLFIFSYLPFVDFGMVGIPWILGAAAAYAAAVLLVFRGLKGHLPKKLGPAMFLYLLINGAMNCFALWQLLSTPCLGSALVFIGAVLFFASDSILFYVRFNKDSRLKTHFPVMLTYVLAEFLIVLGLLRLGG